MRKVFFVLGLTVLSAMNAADGLDISPKPRAEGRPLSWGGPEGFWRLTGESLTPVLVSGGEVKASFTELSRGRYWLVRGNALLADRFDGTGHRSRPIRLGRGASPHLEVRSKVGGVWVAQGKELGVLSRGEIRLSASFEQEVLGLALSPAADRLWVATEKSVEARDPETSERKMILPLGQEPQVLAMLVEPESGDVIVVLETAWLRFDAFGSLLARSDLGGMRSLVADGFGGAWGLWGEQVLRIDPEGKELLVVTPFSAPELPVDLVLDEATKSLWVASRRKLLRLSAAGEVLETIPLPRQAALRRFARTPSTEVEGSVDRQPPHLEVMAQEHAASELAASEFPSIDLSLYDFGAGVDISSLRFSWGDQQVPADCKEVPGGARCEIEAVFPPGKVFLGVTVADMLGNRSESLEFPILLVAKPKSLPVLLGGAWEERGITPHRHQFRGEAFETIDLASGRLLLDIPLGLNYEVGPLLSYQFRLAYNSNVWRKVVLDCAASGRPCGGEWQSPEEYEENPPTGTRELSVPHPDSNAGLGWQLHFGRLYSSELPAGLGSVGKSLWPHRQNAGEPPSSWLFIEPDGTEHRFYRPGDRPDRDQQGRSVSYTLDSSRLRLREESPVRVVLERPDGVKSTFERTGATEGTLFCGRGVVGCWRLTSLADPYGNELNFSYLSASASEETWILTDSTGRQHFLRFLRSETSVQTLLPRGDSSFLPVNLQEVGLLRSRLEEVDLAAFGGRRAVYSFKYFKGEVGRGCLTTDSKTESFPFGTTQSPASVLRRIDVPLQQDFYFDTAQGAVESCSDEAGRLTEMTLPTGGHLRYSWGFWKFLAHPLQKEAATLSSSGLLPYPGLVRKERLSPDGEVEGGWELSSDLESWPPTGEGSERSKGALNHRRTVVTGPPIEGRVSKRVFFTSLRPSPVKEGVLPAGAYSRVDLPIRNDPFEDGSDSLLFLSSEIYQCSAEEPCSSKDRLRSVYRQYATEPPPDICRSTQSAIPQSSGPQIPGPQIPGPQSSGPQSFGTPLVFPCSQNNVVLVAEKTVFHDDQDRFVERSWHEFNGLGVARIERIRDDFLGETGVRFEEWRDWNTGYSGVALKPVSGVLPVVDFQQSYPSPEDTWNLTALRSSRRSKEGLTYRTDYLLDEAGQPICARHFADPEKTGPSDVVVHWQRGHRSGVDAGMVTSEWRLGGDGAALPTEELCPKEDPAGTAVYREEFAYQHLQLARRQRLPLAESFRALIDSQTGLPAATFSPAGRRTDWQYDLLGRTLRKRPEAILREATTTWVYRSPEDVDSSTETFQWNLEGDLLTKEISVFDPFGRLKRQEKLRALDTGELGPSERRFSYDAEGRLERQSVWQDPSLFHDRKSFLFSGYDPFDQPQQIVAPDGTSRRFSYAGIRVLQERKNLQTSENGDEEELVLETHFDSRGELRRLVTPSFSELYLTDPDDALFRLTRRVGETSQDRQWTRDGRGFLVEESHPELGPSSEDSGAIRYLRNALGLLVERFDGEHRLTFERDRGGRMTVVREGDRIWRELFWNDTDRGLPQGGIAVAGELVKGSPRGALAREVRHNYVGAPGPESDWRVTDTYLYEGALQRLSHRRTQVDWFGSEGESRPGPVFSTRWSYDSLGRPRQQQYPICSGAGCSGGDSAAGFNHIVTSEYQADQMVQVSSPVGLSATYTYQANFELHRTLFGNGVLGLYGPDPDGLPRSRRLRFLKGAEAYFDSGFSRYDAAGRRWGIGVDRRIYDAVGQPIIARVAGKREEVNGSGQGGLRSDRHRFREERRYDALGNLDFRRVPGLGENSFRVDHKNRLVGWSSSAERPGSADLEAEYDLAGRRIAWQRGSEGPVEAAIEWDALNQPLAFRQYQPGEELQIHLYGPGNQRVATYDSVDRAIRWHQRDLQGRVLRSWFQAGSLGSGEVADEVNTTLVHEKDVLYGPDGLLAILGPGPQQLYVHRDLSGHSRLTTNARGELVGRWLGLLPGTPIQSLLEEPLLAEPLLAESLEREDREDEEETDSSLAAMDLLCGSTCWEAEPNRFIWRLRDLVFDSETQRLLAPDLLRGWTVDSPGRPWSLYAPGFHLNGGWDSPGRKR